MLRSNAAIVAACVAGVLAGPARAADDPGVCTGFGDLKSGPAITLARIRSADRTFFVKGASDRKGCPDATQACRAKGYLVAGDRVIASASRGGFTCVDYISAAGADRAGWLPDSSLAREAPVPVTREDWLGTWVQTESKIAIKPSQFGRLGLQGEATFGALDPDRVKRGAVNMGEFQAEVAPEGANLAFDMGDKTTLPVTQGDETDCKLWMRRLGPFLLVEDNSQCGGLNVSFTGAYRLKAHLTSGD
ncbi:hypothetical protein [Lichenifustis flavocetrariae]|uniref:Uncharacterized protein n=1 Tax=Lichenifustis flavocetrariae TaxID=2949735 RepID=A0AA41Z8M7_9HYPH|nr:hypothetical protein [Lichenifustis flavocetrariae]MCW6511367.1 hypothetical protein [Lichenifustis flavocetrariae]